MNHLHSYLNRVAEESQAISNAIGQTVDTLWKKNLSGFNYKEHLIGLIFGQVQSGKTSNILGILAKAADENFKLFIVLTTDNVSLQKQTLERALYSLDTFNVCDETDDMRFRAGGLRKPVLLVLKKNQSVLKTWKNHLASIKAYKYEPLFIIDDEGDAGTLNTRINANEQSRINSLVNGIRSASPSSIFLSVTATPQALVLQTIDSVMRPKFAYVVDPGKSYLGGEFFYSESSQCPRLINENERKDLLIANDIPPEGLRKSILSFLIAGCYRDIIGKNVTNLLIHPSIRINDHKKVEIKVNAYLNNIKSDLANDSLNFKHTALDAWMDLKNTEPMITPFDQCYERFKQIIDKIKILVINSNSAYTHEYDSGYNIIIGGNSLGRGLTFSGLHSVYYSRTVKTPQADTSWQHSRMFGYDRMPGLCRVYLPPSLLHLFRELNEANESMIKVLKNEGIDRLSLLSYPGTRPTRRNVIKLASQVVIVGGVNYFPQWPTCLNVAELDNILGLADSENVINISKAIQILQKTGAETNDTFDKTKFINSLVALGKSDYQKGCRLIVRINRSIGKGTGTLLSPNDRAASDSYSDQLVLTLYRLNGETEKGWDGNPLWVPNVKLPSGKNYCEAKN